MDSSSSLKHATLLLSGIFKNKELSFSSISMAPPCFSTTDRNVWSMSSKVVLSCFEVTTWSSDFIVTLPGWELGRTRIEACPPGNKRNGSLILFYLSVSHGKGMTKKYKPVIFRAWIPGTPYLFWRIPYGVPRFSRFYPGFNMGKGISFQHAKLR